MSHQHFDNGKEFAEHERTAAELQAAVYFAPILLLGARIEPEQQWAIAAALPEGDGTS